MSVMNKAVLTITTDNTEQTFEIESLELTTTQVSEEISFTGRLTARSAWGSTRQDVPAWSDHMQTLMFRRE